MNEITIAMEPKMSADEYQEKAHAFAAYKDGLYPVLGLAEEACEVAGKVAKHLRRTGKLNWDAPDGELAPALRKEVGDCLWMLAEICSVYGWRMSDVMAENIAKLEDRANRGVICGEGDNR